MPREGRGRRPKGLKGEEAKYRKGGKWEERTRILPRS